MRAVPTIAGLLLTPLHFPLGLKVPHQQEDQPAAAKLVRKTKGLLTLVLSPSNRFGKPTKRKRLDQYASRGVSLLLIRIFV